MPDIVLSDILIGHILPGKAISRFYFSVVEDDHNNEELILHAATKTHVVRLLLHVNRTISLYNCFKDIFIITKMRMCVKRILITTYKTNPL